MSLTGLFLCVFLVEHLTGNLLLLVSKDEFNVYSHFLSHNPLIRAVEIILFASVVMHIGISTVLTLKNRSARPVQYAMYKGSANSRFVSRNMYALGFIILIFLVIHLSNFFVKARFGGVQEYALEQHVSLFGLFFPAGSMVGDIYSVVIASFKQLWYTVLYVVCMVALSLHLAHGFQSAFHSSGVYTGMPRASAMQKVGWAFAILIPLGFAFIPVYVYLMK